MLLKWENGVSGVLGDSGASWVCFNFWFLGILGKLSLTLHIVLTTLLINFYTR